VASTLQCRSCLAVVKNGRRPATAQWVQRSFSVVVGDGRPAVVRIGGSRRDRAFVVTLPAVIAAHPSQNLVNENPCGVPGTSYFVASFCVQSICDIGRNQCGTTLVTNTFLTHPLCLIFFWTWPHACNCLSSTDPQTGARPTMLCGLCLLQSAADERGHVVRRCPLRQLECRYGLSNDSPLALSGRCFKVQRSHAQQCSVCGLIGHERFTIKLDTTRWKLSTLGIPVPRVHSPPALTRTDFLCPLMSELQVLRLVTAAHKLALAPLL